MELLPGHYTLYCAIKALEQSFIGNRREQSTHLFFHWDYCFCLEGHTGWSAEQGYCSSAVLFVCWMQELSDMEVISDYSNLIRIWEKSTSWLPNLPTMRPRQNWHVQFPHMRNTFIQFQCNKAGLICSNATFPWATEQLFPNLILNTQSSHI